MFVLALLPNILCVVVFRRLGLHKPINFLFAVLAAVDVLGLTSQLVNIIVTIFLTNCTSQTAMLLLFVFGKLSPFFLDFLSPMVMLFIASIRFRALSEITQEHKHTMFFNLKRIKSALMRLAVSAVVIYSPLLMFGNTVIRISYYCYSFKPIEPGNDVEFQLWFSLVFGCIMCILLTIVSGLMLRVCFKPRPIEDILDLDIPCSQKDMRNTSYVIISIVFCNIITFILHSINIFSILDGLHSFSLTNSSEISIINTHNICTIYCANSAANIFLHCGREKFSKTLKQMLCSCRKVEKQQRLMQDH